VKKIQPYIGDEPCMLTYGDGVSKVNIPELLRFHAKKKKIGTLTAIRPPRRLVVRFFSRTPEEMIDNSSTRDGTGE
jgi:glucose-1-phosphate cytidylyltransferase